MTDILRDMRRFFDAGAISRGVDYHGRGLVKSIRPDPSGSPVEGRVSGSGGRVYEQYVYLDWAVSGRLIEVDGECTCPVGWNCKHVVAVVLASERQLNSRGSGLKSGKVEGLPYEVTDWLNTLEQAESKPPKPTNDCIVYVIDRERGQPSVLPMKSRILKSGDLSTSAKPYSPDRALGYSVPKFLEPSDIQILASLAHHQDYSGYGSGHSLPTGGLGQWLFEEIVKTGRARLGAIDGVALAFGGEREARFDWVTTPSGMQVMAAIDAEQRELMPLGLTPPWYVDLQTGAAGPIATDLDPMRAAHIAAAPALPPEAASKVTKRLAKAKDAPLPRVPEQSERKDIAPKPQLSLRAIPAPLKPQNRSPQTVLLPAIDVRFDYDGVLTSPRETAKKLRRTTEQKIETILRDARAEDGFLDELSAQAYAFGFEDIDGPSTHAAHVLPNTPEQTAQAIAFMTESLPALESEGWHVDIDESWPYRFSPETPEISGRVTQSDNDWFALAFSIKVGDVTAELAPILAQIVTELSPALLADPNLADALEETTWTIPNVGV